MLFAGGNRKAEYCWESKCGMLWASSQKNAGNPSVNVWNSPAASSSSSHPPPQQPAASNAAATQRVSRIVARDDELCLDLGDVNFNLGNLSVRAVQSILQWWFRWLFWRGHVWMLQQWCQLHFTSWLYRWSLQYVGYLRDCGVQESLPWRWPAVEAWWYFSCRRDFSNQQFHANAVSSSEFVSHDQDQQAEILNDSGSDAAVIPLGFAGCGCYVDGNRQLVGSQGRQFSTVSCESAHSFRNQQQVVTWSFVKLDMFHQKQYHVLSFFCKTVQMWMRDYRNFVGASAFSSRYRSCHWRVILEWIFCDASTSTNQSNSCWYSRGLAYHILKFASLPKFRWAWHRSHWTFSKGPDIHSAQGLSFLTIVGNMFNIVWDTFLCGIVVHHSMHVELEVKIFCNE